jgi:hypothetical protein
MNDQLYDSDLAGANTSRHIPSHVHPSNQFAVPFGSRSGLLLQTLQLGMCAPERAIPSKWAPLSRNPSRTELLSDKTSSNHVDRHREAGEQAN